jgi:hypothetical protein
MAYPQYTTAVRAVSSNRDPSSSGSLSARCELARF